MKNDTPLTPESAVHTGPNVIRSEDIHFAVVSLEKLDAWPWIEVRLVAQNKPVQPEDIEKLLAFLSVVLEGEEGENGFGITYDFRFLKQPSVAVLLAIARWAQAPGRKELFVQRCIACSTCVTPGWKYYATRAAMSSFFQIQPPTCKTYLVTDFDSSDCISTSWDPPATQSRSLDTAAETSAARENAMSPQQGLQPQAPGLFQRLCGGLCARRQRPLEEELLRLRRQIEELENRDRERQRFVEQMGERLAELENPSGRKPRRNLTWCGPSAQQAASCPRRRNKEVQD